MPSGMEDVPGTSMIWDTGERYCFMSKGKYQFWSDSLWEGFQEAIFALAQVRLVGPVAVISQNSLSSTEPQGGTRKWKREKERAKIRMYCGVGHYYGWLVFNSIRFSEEIYGSHLRIVFQADRRESIYLLAYTSHQWRMVSRSLYMYNAEGFRGGHPKPQCQRIPGEESKSVRHGPKTKCQQMASTWSCQKPTWKCFTAVWVKGRAKRIWSGTQEVSRVIYSA